MTNKNLLRSIDFWCIIFFAAYLVLGIYISRDYGISWDENVKHMYVGEATYNYIFHDDTLLFEHVTKCYGPVFDFGLYALEKVLSLHDTREIYLMRHLITFLLFYTSVLVFFFLCRRLFGSALLAMFASVIFVICPHIFAHSFYNSTDIPFLSLFIIAVASMLYLGRRLSWGMVAVHSFITALAIDVRILGVLIPIFTIGLMLGIFFIEKKLSLKKLMYYLFTYLTLTSLLVIAFWPYLWPAPIKNFQEAFISMSKFVQYGCPVTYMGNDIVPSQVGVPWHYIAVWMGITLPISYIFSFLSGTAVLIYEFIKQPFKTFYTTYASFVIVFLLLLTPMISVIIFRSVLYDEWRHLFFIYPLFVIIAVLGFRFLYSAFKKKILRILLVLLVAGNMASVVFFMIVNHPFQNVYFNCFAGDMQSVKNNYELDYWGLSFRQALEYIAKTDSSPQIRVCVSCEPGVYNGMMLPEKDRSRIVFVDSEGEYDYFLTNYRWHKDDYDYKNEYYSIKVGNAKIMSVFKLSDDEK